MPRLTISLDDDLYAMARSHSVAMKCSISKAIADLMRRRLHNGPDSMVREEVGIYLHPVSGFPVSAGAGPRLTSEDVRGAEDDEDVRILETMRLDPEEIERSRKR